MWAKARWRWLWGSGLFSAALSALGFVVESNSAGQVRRWQVENPDGRVKVSSVNRATRSIIYRLDAGAYSATNGLAELQAVRAAFDQWQGVSGTRVRFEEGPVVSGTTDIDSQDHTNTVFWARNLLVNGGRDSLHGVLALTYVASFRDGNVIFDADTVFNGVQYSWGTDFHDETGSKAFVESVALHEAGHFLGLQHSPVGGATMIVAGGLGVNAQLGLSWDEWTAARGLYPTADMTSKVGRITGRVSSSGLPVFGAAVFAENAGGELISGTVTGSDGAYALAGLPEGVVAIRTAPLDPASALNYLIRGSDISTAYSGAQTGFAASADRVTTVSGGGTLANVNFDVIGANPPRVARILLPATDLSAPSYTSFRAGVLPDGTARYVGVLTTTRPGANWRLEITGKGFEAGAVEVREGALPGMTLIALPVAFATNAAPGLRSLRLRNGTQTGWAHGFLEILPLVPDVNGDGLDDRFQRRYWTRFTAPEAAPLSDPDRDGFSNEREYRTGSVPTDALSARFRIESVRVTASGAVVRSQAATGKRFRLSGKDTVEGARWVVIGEPMTAVSDVIELVDPTSTRTDRFYRVEMVP